MTNSQLEASELANRISILEDTGTILGVRFFRCIDVAEGIQYEGASWDFGAHSIANARRIIELLRTCQSLTFQGLQRPITFTTSNDGLLVLSEWLAGQEALARDEQNALLTTERALYLTLELTRIVAHLHSVGLPITMLPTSSIVEVPSQGIKLRHPWLLAMASELLIDSNSKWPELQAAIPPEVAEGGAPTTRTGVYAIAYLMLSVLDQAAPDRNDERAQLPITSHLEQVLRRGALRSTRHRHANMHEFAIDVENGRPSRRSTFSPAERINLDYRRESVELDHPRLLLPKRPVPESTHPKIRAWMVGTVTMVGLVAFLVILPRIQNPLIPLQETLDEVRSIFSVGGPVTPQAESQMSSMVIPGQPFQIPDFRGRQQAEAQIQAEAMGLNIEIGEEFDSESSPGTVIGQDPDPGATVTNDYRVTLFVNKGEANAFLVSVIGKTAVEARDTLVNLGFLVLEVPVFDEVKPSGEVVGQKPPGDNVIRKGEQVVLEVSRGPERITIPALIGLAEASAVQKATDAGLSLRSEFHQQVPAGFLPGTVYAQEPVEGSLVEPQAEILIMVYRPEPITVPRVIGMTPNQAFALLISSGLSIASIVERDSTSATEWIVVNQIPSSGIRVARESSMRLFVERPSQSPSPTPPTSP